MPPDLEGVWMMTSAATVGRGNVVEATQQVFEVSAAAQTLMDLHPHRAVV